MSINNTIRLQHRARVEAGLDKNENRPKKYGAWGIVYKDTVATPPTGATFTPRSESILRPDVNAGIQSDRNFLEADGSINFASVEVNRFNPVIGNTYNDCATPADTSIETALVVQQKKTYSFKIALNKTKYTSNDYRGPGESADDAMMREWNLQFQRGCEFITAAVDADVTALFDLAVNQYWVPGQGPLQFYPEVGNVLQVTQAQKPEYFYDVQPMFKSMYYNDEPIRILHGAKTLADVNRYLAQGTANAENLNAQFVPGRYDFNYTDQGLVPAVGQESIHYAVAPFQTFMSYRVQESYAEGESQGDGIREWSMMPGNMVPYLGIPLSEYYQENCAGTTRGATPTFSWQYHVDVITGFAYNSDQAGQYNPILKTAFLL